MKKKANAPLMIVFVGCAVLALSVTVFAAYFAKGVFKDVFVNKRDCFSANVLYNIDSLDGTKREVGSSGNPREIIIYNHDVSSGDFNSFDITVDVYAWLDGELPQGKTYTLYDNAGNPVLIDKTGHTEPVFRNLMLPGGRRSTVNLRLDFGFSENEDVTGWPGVHIVAVPSAPERMTGTFLGAVIRPSGTEEFAVNYGFDSSIGEPEQYAAFTYQVSTAGNAPEGDSLVIKWNSKALQLIKMNGVYSDSLEITEIAEGEFDSQIVWDIQSNHTDSFVFFRNAENDMWQTGDPGWELINEQVTVEHIQKS
ncbi:MAG: hypothetical protein PUC05_02910 [Firmicutes bacterium]|nr:hypothetical protein [Bacillota bacterium]